METESIKREPYVLPESVAVYPGQGANTTIGASRAEYGVFESKPHDPNLSGEVLWLESWIPPAKGKKACPEADRS